MTFIAAASSMWPLRGRWIHLWLENSRPNGLLFSVELLETLKLIKCGSLTLKEVDLEVGANFRSRLRSRLFWKGKFVCRAESKRSWNWKNLRLTPCLERSSSFLGLTGVRPRKEKFLSRHEKFVFYFSNFWTFRFRPTEDLFFTRFFTITIFCSS